MFPSFSLLVMASLSISWLHGFQVLQVSSPDPPAQLGLGGAKGVSLCRSVSWIVRLEERSEVRGELSGRGWRWVVCCCYLVPISIGFRKSRFGLGSVDERQTWVGIISQYEADFIRFIDGQTTICSGTFTFLIPASKLSRCCSSCCCLIAQKSAQHQKGCAGPPYCRNNCWPP